ncbi:hypothetical protein [Pseudoteredinibacter isoporae]|uniref:hypothetical protein n=1 Tax=Pseudoteredinibacter isoporae TaxID=570281 RepID=UPI003103DD28
MKWMTFLFLSIFLVACSDAKDPSLEAAETALSNLKEGRKLLSAITTISEAKASEARIAEIGQSYKAAIEIIGQNKDPDITQELMKMTPHLASEYQGLILDLNALQSRNVEAGNIILDEIRAFKTK